MPSLLQPPNSAAAIVQTHATRFPNLLAAMAAGNIPALLTPALIDELDAVEKLATAVFPRQQRQAILAWVTRLRDRSCSARHPHAAGGGAALANALVQAMAHPAFQGAFQANVMQAVVTSLASPAGQAAIAGAIATPAGCAAVGAAIASAAGRAGVAAAIASPACQAAVATAVRPDLNRLQRRADLELQRRVNAGRQTQCQDWEPIVFANHPLPPGLAQPPITQAEVNALNAAEVDAWSEYYDLGHWPNASLQQRKRRLFALLH